MLLLIDNYDSFTYNLVQIIEALDQEIAVFRNDKITLEEMKHLKPEFLMISPGPCTPKEAGISVEAIRYFGDKIPVLGVCLGHQSAAVAYGGQVLRADRIMHGKTSSVFHDGKTIFEGLPNPFKAIRYHSLIVDKATLPDVLEINAWTKEGEIMGVRHRNYPAHGVQFHPESILTRSGPEVVRNFLRLKGI